MKGKTIILGVLLPIVSIGFFYTHYLKDADTALNQSFDHSTKINNNDNNVVSRPNQDSSKSHKLKENVINDKIEVEVTLYDLEQNKLLTKCEIEIMLYDFYHHSELVKLKSESDGKIIYYPNKVGFCEIYLFVKGYAVQTQRLTILYGRNDLKAFFTKGGVVEVQVTNQENKIPDNLECYLVTLNEDQKMPLVLDVNRGVYVISNMPLGNQVLSFTSKGHQIITTSVFLDSNSISNLNLKLIPSKYIYLDLDIDEKPYSIKVLQRFTSIKIQSLTNEHDRSDINLGQVLIKDKNNLYPFLYENIPLVTIIVENFLSKDVLLIPQQKIYKVTLEKANNFEIKIVDKNGNAIVGANISYNKVTEIVPGLFTEINKSDQNGISQIIIPNKTNSIYIKISHDNFEETNCTINDSLSSQKPKIVVMEERKPLFFSGKIKFGDKLVKGACVQILEENNKDYKSAVHSDENGNYQFNNLIYYYLKPLIGKKLFIKAYHPFYGTAISPVNIFRGNTEGVDLDLTDEHSVMAKLVDKDAMPLPNKKVVLFDSGFEYSLLTDEKGEVKFYCFFNEYNSFKLLDEKLMLIGESINTPKESFLLTAGQKDLRKVVLLGQNEWLNKSVLSLRRGNDKSWTTLSCIYENGNYFIDCTEDYFTKDTFLIFDLPGFEIVRMGPYKDLSDYPKEFIVNLLRIAP